jgi:hypothetical protein
MFRDVWDDRFQVSLANPRMTVRRRKADIKARALLHVQQPTSYGAQEVAIWRLILATTTKTPHHNAALKTNIFQEQQPKARP